MAKLTVSQDHVRLYPELEDQLGKAVDASVILKAQSNAKFETREAKRIEAQKAKEVVSKATAPKKVASKTKVKKATKSKAKKTK